MALRRAEASSPDCPPERNATPGTAAGTARSRHSTVASAICIDILLRGTSRSRQDHVGFQDQSFQSYPLRVEFAEEGTQHPLRHFATRVQCVRAFHEHLRFDDRDQPGFLAERRIPRQRVSVGLDAPLAGKAIADGKHRPPFGEARAHLRILDETRAQPVEALRDLLSRKCRHRLCPDIDLDAGNDAEIGEGFGEGSAIVLTLANGFVVENGATDRLAKTRRVDDQLPILATGLGVLREFPIGRSACCKSQYFRRSPTVLFRWRPSRLRWLRELGYSLGVAPFPVANLRHILAVSVDVVLVLDEFVAACSASDRRL